MLYLKKALGYIARKRMRTMMGPIKKKKNSSMAVFLESQNNSCTQTRKLHLQQLYLSDPSFGLQGRPAQKSHHTRKVGEEKCSVQNGEKGEV